MVQALLFDTFGTVVDWRGTLIRDLTAWGTEHAPSVDWTGLVDAWRAAYAPSMDRVRRGDQPWTRLDDLHMASLRTLAPKYGLRDLPDADWNWINTAWHRLDPWPDSVEGLSRLRGRFTVAPLSNGNLSLLLAMAKRAGLPWDTVFGADVFRHYKPDPETYLGAAALLDLPPAEVMMCAAHNADLRAARALGLRTAFILRPVEYGPHQEKDTEAEENWDHVVGSITELADVLGA